MADLLGHLPALQATLDTLRVRHGVPGAMLSVYDGERTVDLVAGVANAETGVEVTPDTLFQIGSITKVYTATLVMRLVDQGRIDLDAPIRRYLPSFRLRDEEAAATITCRHLLNHSSGIVGDHHADFGEGDDCLERYVASLAEHDQVHAPGRMTSYSNVAFEVAGRVVEAVCGRPFDQVFAEELLGPLGLRRTTVVPTEMLRHRYAVGHDGQRPVPHVAANVLMYRSTVPAGGRTSATAADVLRFARIHMDGGRTPNGETVLSEDGARTMQTPTLPMPSYQECGIGVGWLIWEWAGEPCLFHTGGTINQLSWLCALPQRRFAVCLLTNAGTGGLLWRDLSRWVFGTLAGVEPPRQPTPPATPPAIDLHRYAGTYERLTQRFAIEARDGHLHATIATESPLRGDSTMALELRPIDEERFHTVVGDDLDMVVTFLEPDDQGRPTYLHFASRAAGRTG
jgi:CubicO group peptidase (beta-lactamase class C family)